MKATDLRVGNYFMFGAMRHMCSYHDIANLSKNEMRGEPNNDLYQPIPITEEWLLKFGFDKVGCMKLPNQTTLQITLNKIGSVIWNANRSQFIELSQEMQYVHQLQNLYFALTGEELKIVTPVS